ncbi:MAG: diguanylate cyclase [bacterium]
MKQGEIYYDALTGVYNRRFLHYWVDNEIKRAKRFATKFGIIMIDLDNFREVNNNYGHIEGDRVLIEFSNFLKNTVREVDNIVRYGGDEFIILVPNADTQGIRDFAQRILTNLNKTSIDNHKIFCSIGLAVYPDDGANLEVLINQADRLMYQAKKDGKNRIGLKTEITRKLELPARLLIGREEELHWCLRELKERSAIFISGEAGVGKTRLALELKNLFPDLVYLRANSYAALTSIPYHPFHNMFKEIIMRDFDLIQRVLKQMPEILRHEIMKLLPVDKTIPAKIEGLDKFRLFDSVNMFFSKLIELSSSKQVVLLFEDLHWADRSSCELLDFVLRSASRNFMVIGTFRTEEMRSAPISEFLGIWARENLYSKLDLLPLNETQTFKFLEMVMGNISQSTAKFIFNLAGGNPFYTEEILRELERQNKISYNGREWVLLVDRELKFPQSIEGTILRKIQFLDDEKRKFLNIAAVYGQEFNDEIIALCAQRNVGETIDAIDHLVKLGFIKARESESFFFSEDIVRQIVYKNIDRADLIKYHHQVGEAIERYFHTSLSNYYEQLAHHFTIAHDPAKALFYSRQAGIKCKENYAHEQAVEFFTNALKFEDNIEEIFKIKFDLSEIYFLMGKSDKAIENLNACLKINPQDHKIYYELGYINENIGDYKKALYYYTKGLKIAGQTSASYQFKAAMVWVYTRIGQYLKAKKECEQLLKKEKQIPKPELALILITYGVVLLDLGDLEGSVSYLKKALDIRQNLGDKKGMAACYLDIAIVYQQQLNFSVCEEYLKNSLKLYEEIGYQAGIIATLFNFGALYFDYSLTRAEDYFNRALRIAKLIGDKRTVAYIYDNLGSINLRRLMFDDALNSLKIALRYAEETDIIEGKCFINIHLSEFYRETGKKKKGMAHLKKAYRYAKELNLKKYFFDCQFEEIEYLLMDKNFKKAKLLSNTIFARLKNSPDLLRRVYAYIYQGKIASALKEYKKAQNYCNKALNIIVKLPDNSFTAEIYFLQGLTYKKQGKYHEALQMFLKANEIFMKLGNLLYLDRIEREIAAVDISK